MKSFCILAVILFSTKLGVFGNKNITDAVSRSIIGGRDAPRHPFYVSLFIQVENSQGGVGCGGTILTENVVVTAAHCLYNFNLGRWADLEDINVLVSDFTEPSWRSRATNYGVEWLKSYNSRGTKNDIALLKITEEFDMRYNKALPICGGNKKGTARPWPLDLALA